MLYIAAPEQLKLAVFRKRLLFGPGDAASLTLDVTLHSAAPAQTLATVRVQARKPTPSRTEDLSAGAGGGDAPLAGGGAAVLPDQLGNLSDLAQSTIGATPSPMGLSVFGLPSNQNLVTLNGLGVLGVQMPRDAEMRVRVVTSTYDPSRGWFSGAETRAELSQDFLYASRTSSTTVDAPGLSSWNGTSNSSGTAARGVNQGFGATGFVMKGRMSYNASAQARFRASERPSLSDLDGSALSRAGVAKDSAEKLLGLAGQVGIPLNAGPSDPEQVLQSGTLLIGLSTLARNRETNRPNRHVAGVTAYFASASEHGAHLDALRSSLSDDRTLTRTGSLQASLSSYVRPSVLHELRTGLSLASNESQPRFRLPMANVLVRSNLSEDRDGLEAIFLAGPGPSVPSMRRLSWETQSDTRFYARSGHRIRLNAAARFDRLGLGANLADYGTYSYPSIEAFAQQHPARFERTLSDRTSEASVWNGAISIGDYWRARPSFEMLYGLRLDGSTFASQPPRSQAVDSLLGAHRSGISSRLALSPRVGFSWTYRSERAGGFVVRNSHGVFGVPALGVLRGGIGAFRSVMSPDMQIGAQALNAIPNQSHRIVCTGSEVPIPDWSAIARTSSAIATSCTGGLGIDGFRDESPQVRTVASNFTVPQSWRANLSWTSYHRALIWTLDATLARQTHQPGTVNRNFANTPRFYLADEADRPIFVTPASIVAGTGTVASADARLTPRFGPVLESQSRYAGTVAQYTLSLIPDLTRFAQSRYFASLAYTLTQASADLNGFDGTTFDSPFGVTRARNAFTPKHAILAQGSVSARRLSLGLFARITSGLPFTPMIDADVNGDGFSNDRAFVFDASAIADPAMATAMRDLVAHGGPQARRCLQRQLGRPAAANSCLGPWSTSTSARLQLSPSSRPGWANRVVTSVYVANPLTGLDALLHGSRLRGWGDPGMPDPTLLRVQGFDPNNRRFRYAVNPRFGQPRSAFGTAAPFRLTIDVRISFGPSTDQQILDRSLQAGRAGYPGKRRTADEIKRFYLMTLPSPFGAVLSLTDSLLLTPTQVRAVLAAQEQYDTRVDRAVTQLSQWLAALPDRYDGAVALRRQQALFTEILNIGREEVQRSLSATLNPIQQSLLPWPANIMFRATGPITLQDIRR